MPFTPDFSQTRGARYVRLKKIQIIIEDGLSYYPGSFKNGIYSQIKENYIRSFRVVGDRQMTCNYFKEEYSPSNIFSNWVQNDAKNAVKSSLWSFVTNPTRYGLAIHNGIKIEGNLDQQ